MGSECCLIRASHEDTSFWTFQSIFLDRIDQQFKDWFISDIYSKSCDERKRVTKYNKIINDT